MRTPKIVAALKKLCPNFFQGHNLVVAPVRGKEKMYVRIKDKKQAVIFDGEIDDDTNEKIAKSIESKV